MISKKTTDSLKQIALSGGSLEVDAKSITSDSMRQLALSLQPNCYLKICNSDAFTTDSLVSIALARRGQVIFA